MEILRKYEANFPKWYAQVEQDGIRVELNFDHEPSDEEITIAMQEIINQQAIQEVIDGNNNIN